MTDDYEKLRDWMARPDVLAAVARQSESDKEDIPFELIEVAGRGYTLPEPEEPPEQGRRAAFRGRGGEGGDLTNGFYTPIFR
jgi:hypothetical protein